MVGSCDIIYMITSLHYYIMLVIDIVIFILCLVCVYSLVVLLGSRVVVIKLV